MGLLDLFGGTKGALKKHAARAANKRAQAADRWDSLRALASLKTADSAAALLERFTFRVDPSITDQDEKELALEGIVGAGEAAVEPTLAFLRRAESVSWPVKALEQLVSSERLVEELLGVLATMGTEYERDPERKVQLVSLLTERRDERIAPAVVRFLEDADETVRFHAAVCVFEQGPEAVEAHRGALLALFGREESMRLRSRIAEGLLASGAVLASDEAARIEPHLPAGWSLDPRGQLRRR